jgi:hypothetical protein
MEKEPRKILVVFGENVKFGQGKKYLESRESKMHPVAEYVSDTTAEVAPHDNVNGEIWIFGGDAAGVGVPESVQMEERIRAHEPHFRYNIKTFTEPIDTSQAAEAVKQELDKHEHKIQVSTIFPLEHRWRANAQLEANGVEIDHKYKAERVYLTLPRSKEEQLDRIKKIKKIYKSKNMYFDLMRELGLNAIGLFDKKGKFVRKHISERFRKSTMSNPVSKK